MTPHDPPLSADDARMERVVLFKVTLRLLPFLCLLYFINILDRLNIGFAKLQMQPALGLTDAAYGFGAGIFFIGYFGFEVPSNLMLHRLGARRWIARILVSWGVISSCMMFVTGPISFTALRFLLGVAEAGFFPGILLYLTYWFPTRHRARVVSRLMAASPITLIVGGPLSGALMDYMGGVAGLPGWQWLFLLEGMPAVVLGGVTFLYLTDRPAQAKWLTPEQRDWLTEKIAAEESHRERRHGLSLSQTFADRRVWHLILLCATIATGIAGYGYYYPTLIDTRFTGLTKSQVGLLGAIPGVGAMIGMLVVGWSSDRTGERRWHIAGLALLAAGSWVMFAEVDSMVLSILALTLAYTGMASAMATFWSLPSTFLSGRATAGGLALINSFANLGGFVGAYNMGKLKDLSGTYTLGMFVVAGVLTCSALLVLAFRYERPPPDRPNPPTPFPKREGGARESPLPS